MVKKKKKKIPQSIVCIMCVAEQLQIGGGGGVGRVNMFMNDGYRRERRTTDPKSGHPLLDT